ncbi:hypothetical protein GQ600_26906 [Phytophthora cactorum]|nr:hypothetical protein GQ600_26906 [Phytophthora cactorum]
MLRDFLGRSIQGRPIDSKRDGTTDDGAELPDITDVRIKRYLSWCSLYQVDCQELGQPCSCRSNDFKPEAVIFNVEVFNALYISNALQVASTQASTVTIMAVDLLHFWLSMYDVVEILKQVAMRLLDLETQHMSESMDHFSDVSHLSHPTWKDQIESWVNSNVPATKRNERRMSELGTTKSTKNLRAKRGSHLWEHESSLSPQVKFKDGYKPSVAYLRP